MLYKTTEICSAKIFKGVLETCWEVSCKIAEKVFYKNTEKYSAKILIHVLQKYWEVFYRNVGRCSAKIWKGILQNCWGKFRTPHRGIPVTLWASILGDQKIIRNYWEQRHFQILQKVILWNMIKVIQETGGVVIYKYEEIE